MTKHKLALNLSFLTLAALTSGVVAQDTATWNGSTSGDWSNSSNWNSGFVPNGNDVINIAGTSNTTMNNNLTGGALNQYRLFFNAGAGAFTINGSALAFFDFGAQTPKIENNSTNTQTVNANITMDGAGTGGAAEINPVSGDLFFGGTVSLADTTVLNIWGGNSRTVTFNSGIGAATFGQLVLNQKSTTILNGTSNFGGENNLTNANGNITIGANPTDTGASLTVNGTVNGVDTISLQKGTLNINNGATLNTVRFVSSDAGGATNTINQTGGTFNITGNVNSGTASSFLLGHWPAASSYNLSGGNLNSPNAPLHLGWDGQTTFTQTGGTANLQGINFNNGRNVTALYSLGTSGRLNIGSYGMNGNVTNKEMRLAGGILGATATWVGTQNMTVTANSEINTLDAVDNTTARTITLTNVISGAAGITKTGSGLLILNGGGETYNGPTVSSGGTLRISNNILNSSSFTVNAGAALELDTVNMFVGGHGVPLAAAKTLNANGGTLVMTANFDARFGNVNLSNGATWTSNRVLTAYDAYLANTAGGTATVAVANSGGNTSGSTMNGTGGIHLGGTVNFNVADVTGTAVDDLTVTMRLDNGGLGGGTGIVTKQGAGTMLLNGLNTYTGGTIIDGGTLAVDGNQTANRLTNNHPVTVNNTGTFEIRGVNSVPTGGNAVDVTVNSGGRLRVVSGGSAGIGAGGQSHGHLRNITLNGGIVQLDYSGAGSAFNAESFALNGNVSVGGTSLSTIQSSGTTATTGINLNGNRTFTVANAAAGTDLLVTAELQGGGLIKEGPGTLLLNGANSYTTGTTVNGGTLAVDGSQVNNRLTANHAVTVNNSGTFEIRGVNALPGTASAVDVTVNSGGILRVMSGGSDAIGAGGESHAHLRNLTLNGGVVQLAYSGTGSAYQTKSFDLNGNVTVGGTSMSTMQSSGTTGNTGISLSGNCTFMVNNATAGVDLSVTAELEGTGGLIKEGLGTMQLSGVHSYTGPTTINSGTLDLTAGSSIASSSLVTVNNGGVITGTGTMGPVLMGDGSELRPGNSPGILTTGSITTSGGILGTGIYMEIGGMTPGSQHDQIQTSGTITINGGTLVVNIINSYVPNQNDVFWIWLNDSTDLIGGTPGWLTNLPDGTVFPVPETATTDDAWQIHYNVDGDGSGAANDIRLTYVPEPTTTGLLAALLGLGSLRRRRR